MKATATSLLMVVLASACSSSLPAGGDGGPSGGDTSPGTVTLRLSLAGSTSYCDEITCGSVQHISFETTDGKPIDTSPAGCGMVICSAACTPNLCPGIACIRQALAFTGETITWDGGFASASTCGAQRACTLTRYVPAGRYVAVMCATPGTATPGSATGDVPSTCTSAGTLECVRVPFDFPSATTVEGTLPASAG